MNVEPAYEVQERYTHKVSPNADAVVHAVVTDVAELVNQVIPASRFHALVLIGGYGRGEGGVRCVNGEERPNNNLDFLLISRNANPDEIEDWQQDVNRALVGIQDEHQISVDFSVIPSSVLQKTDSRIMWYDMRHGHKTVLGNPSYVPSFERFTLESIPAWDVHNLLVNRGSLLVINDMIAAREHQKCVLAESAYLDSRSAVGTGRDAMSGGSIGTEASETLASDTEASDADVIDRIRARHTVKAIIGYGDALLFFHGRYHWSYAEKQRRMRAMTIANPDFRKLYELAAEARFHPRQQMPAEFADQQQLRALCEVTHLTCEAMRLQQSALRWDDYLDAALQYGLWEDSNSTRGVIRSFRNACRTRRIPPGLSATARLGLRTLSTQRLLGILFPAVLYRSCPASFREHAAEILDATSSSIEDLRVAYLRTWGQEVDQNFSRFLNRIGLSLDVPESVS